MLPYINYAILTALYYPLYTVHNTVHKCLPKGILSKGYFMTSLAIPLHTETLGAQGNPPVILIHGLFGDLDNLKSIGRALQDKFYVVTVDLRNHGDSPWVNDMSFEAMAADILAIIEHHGFAQVHLLGHSLGGKVAMQVAQSYPEKVASLIIADIAPVAYPPSHQTILTAMANLPLGQVHSRKDADQVLAKDIMEPGVRAFLLKNLRLEHESWSWRLNLAVIQDNYLQLIGSHQQLPPYLGPVLFIKGSLSEYILPEYHDMMLLSFPYHQLESIEGAGHWLHAEKPLVFNQITLRFLGENS